MWTRGERYLSKSHFSHGKGRKKLTDSNYFYVISYKFIGMWASGKTGEGAFAGDEMFSYFLSFDVIVTLLYQEGKEGASSNWWEVEIERALGGGMCCLLIWGWIYKLGCSPVASPLSLFFILCSIYSKLYVLLTTIPSTTRRQQLNNPVPPSWTPKLPRLALPPPPPPVAAVA